MKVQMRLQGIGRINAQLRRLEAKARSYRATVGYDAPYAIYVHENLEANHPIGQAKFLTDPVRLKNKEMSKVFYTTLRLRGSTLKQAVQAVADYWLSESLKLVPIDTGFLYLSGYAKVSNHELNWD